MTMKFFFRLNLLCSTWPSTNEMTQNCFKTFLGAGALIDHLHVLTAAHKVVQNASQGVQRYAKYLNNNCQN